MAAKNIPNHIAIIPDGNRRWAKMRNLPTFEGHRRGFNLGNKIAKKVRSLGINTLTFWLFSTENWNRSKEEISYLMKLYEIFIDKSLKEALKEQVRVIHLGRKERIPKSLLKKIEDIEQKTKNFSRFYQNIALDYGGQDEILRAAKNLKGKNATAENFNELLDTKDQPFPNPDLVIRTGGEQRISGFMLWQVAYSEFIFLDKYFPDFKESDIDLAVLEYSKRQRRFGR